MDTVTKLISILPWTDWAALAAFFAAWASYAWFARDRSQTMPSVLASTNRIRRLWMMQTTYRETRVLDGVVIQAVTSPFFADHHPCIVVCSRSSQRQRIQLWRESLRSRTRADLRPEAGVCW